MDLIDITKEDLEQAYSELKLYIAKDHSHMGALRLATVWHLEQVRLFKNRIANLQDELEKLQ